MGFAFFLLLNAILFIRPAELIESLQPLRLYQLTILLCLGCSYTHVFRQFGSKSLASRPLSICVVGLLGVIIVSHLRFGSIYDARTSGFEFFKIVLYTFLLVATIDTAKRLQTFLNCLVCFTGVAACLALAQFYGYIDIPALAAYEQREFDAVTGEYIVFPRLCSTGIFNDPNDVCLLLSLAIIICLYRFFTPNLGSKRFVWVLPIGIFLLAFIETKSRGGFLSLSTALCVLLLNRFGLRRTLLILSILAPAAAALVGGRMTNIDVADGTGQHRIQLWREALGLLREYPILGVGQGMLPEYTRLVAHNSYVHAFAELGLVGGGLFVSLVFLSIGQLVQMGRYRTLIPDDEIRRFLPYLLGICAGFCMGIMTLSRVYIVPTYMIFGLVIAYLALQEGVPQLRDRLWRFDGNLAGKMAAVSILALVTLELGSRVLVRWES